MSPRVSFMYDFHTEGERVGHGGTPKAVVVREVLREFELYMSFYGGHAWGDLGRCPKLLRTSFLIGPYALHEVVAEVVWGQLQCAQVDKTGDSQKGEGPPRRVDQTEVVDGEAADVANLVEDVGGIVAVQLQVVQLQPPQSWQLVQQLLHVLENGSARPVDVDLVVLPGKVAGEGVAEGLDVGQVAVHVAPLGHDPLEGADVVEVLLGDEVEAPQFRGESMEGGARALVI